MESEKDPTPDARVQLREYERGARAARQQAHVPAPLWFWPTMALVAPAVVAFKNLEGSLRVAVCAAFLIPVAAAFVVQGRRERSNPARPKAPIRGGHMSLWRLPTLWCFIFGLQASWLLPWSSGFAIAASCYCFIAIGASFFQRKSDRWIMAKTTAPIL